MLRIKRIYDEPAESDGYRVLVDRLWPRGVSKQRAALDLWLKEIAPSPELRTWFGHKPEKFAEFSARYTDELEKNPEVSKLKKLIKQNPDTTLLYGAKAPAINHAAVLQKFIEDTAS
ncbi:MAG TPA: DUF488 domain-containing protein [Candidatus Saccharimonadales bacterium]|nr:DUF488 domain-containing protein [Candidatus Saccharimonadales bacterium]